MAEIVTRTPPPPVSRIEASQDITEQKTLVQERTQALQQSSTALQQEIIRRQHIEQQLRARLTEIETLEERLRLAFAVGKGHTLKRCGLTSSWRQLYDLSAAACCVKPSDLDAYLSLVHLIVEFWGRRARLAVS